MTKEKTRSTKEGHRVEEEEEVISPKNLSFLSQLEALLHTLSEDVYP